MTSPGVRDYHCDFYDSYFLGVDGDEDFYVGEARDVGGPVIELGSGTGRILLQVAAAGLEITGIEPNIDLMVRCRQKLSGLDQAVRDRVKLALGDMQTFSVAHRFPLAIIPYRSFQHLLAPQDQYEGLANIRAHLDEDGLLVFNTFDPLQEIASSSGTHAGLMRRDTDFANPDTGRRVTVWYTRDFDTQSQLIEQELVFEEFDGDGHSIDRRTSRLVLRYTPQGEMRYLLERSGFALEALYGDFHGTPSPGYGEQIWVARKRL